MVSKKSPRPKVLLVEDCKDTAVLLKAKLERLGADATAVYNGVECLHRALKHHARDEPFQLIILDINLPLMNGNEVVKTLRDVGYEGPVVAITATASPRDIGQSAALGFDDFLSKRNLSDAVLGELLQKFIPEQ